MARNHVRLGTALFCSSLFFVLTTAVGQTASSALPQKPATNTTGAVIEVAVVRLHPPAVVHNNFRFSKDRFELEDQPILKLIAFAYSLNPHQIAGAPGWVSSDHYDMSGTTNLTADATVPQQQQLLRQLLNERFGLKFHREKQQMSAYALLVLKGEPKLGTAAHPDAQPLEWTDGHGWERTENFSSYSMTDFVVMQQLFMDRPLVDRTGLAGRYDFKLTYSYGNAPDANADSAPTIFTAIQEQLGLKLQPVKAPVDAFVIDQIERPTPN